jgi:hypothetical protein
MGWETRNGRGRYYTRSRREGGRIVREYVGCGPLADDTARLDAMFRELDQQERHSWEAVQAEQTAITARVAAADEIVEALSWAALVAAGYHAHRGTWRKRRG